ncbi:MAG TPA: DUF2065 domain-containing protein [Rhodospirillales bacterium]|jgi:hypothetical protein
MADLITALALAVTLEGIAYALFPDGMKTMMARALEQPAGTLRTAGLLAAAAGVFVLWLVRG